MRGGGGSLTGRGFQQHDDGEKAEAEARREVGAWALRDADAQERREAEAEARREEGERMRAINYPDNYLVIEFTNRCPLRCTHCIQSLFDKYDHFVEFGYLDPKVLHGLLSDLAETGIRFQNLITFWIGEPVQHPRFAEMYLDILTFNEKYRIFDQIEVNTSGIPLTRKTAEAILAGGRFGEQKQKWHFTIDATTADVYHKVKGRDEFERSQKNIEQFMALREAVGVKFPRVVYQFIVREDNHHQAVEFRDRCLALGAKHNRETTVVAGGVEFIDDRDSVFFRLYDAIDFDNQAASNELYHRVTEKLGIDPVGPHRSRDAVFNPPRETPVCSGMWKSPTINWDGRVTVCTRDSGLELSVGDLRKAKFSEMWWDNPTMERMRAAQASRNYGEIKLCEGCIIPRSANYTGISESELDDWRRKTAFNHYRMATAAARA